MHCCIRAVLILIGLTHTAMAGEVVFPPRSTNAPSGSEFVKQIASLDFTAREAAIYSQISDGNVPDLLRSFCPVSITNATDGKTNIGTIFVAADYLAVGSDEDYFLTPMSPVMAQRLADRLRCALPTRKLVNEIWRAAVVKLTPAPMSPDADMVTVRRFAEHGSIVHTQRLAQLVEHPLGCLVAGHKKDVVVTSRLAEATNRVAIYGWHKLDGNTIQPLYLGHAASWVDYSHGIRLIRQEVMVNGESRQLAEVLADPKLAALFSDEGPVVTSSYKRDALINDHAPHAEKKAQPELVIGAPSWSDFEPTGSFGEQSLAFRFEPDVRVLVNAPLPSDFAGGKRVRLVFYALPNGNTIEQTVGKKLEPGDDWHYNIQHIGAQSRWLRQRLTNEILVIAYLEAAMKSWPAWRQKHGDSIIPDLIATVAGIFRTNEIAMTLTGHSGGGSLTFGYINAVERIPDEINRIAFLDSNYAYSTTNHLDKLLRWLQSGKEHTLCVIAYQDYLGLLDGKPFVSEAGGTWGRSLEMRHDLSGSYAFNETTLQAGLNCARAANGRITFLLKENPERKIFHTVQVERNGFIHSQLVATGLEGRGYEYFGDRVYDELIK